MLFSKQSNEAKCIQGLINVYFLKVRHILNDRKKLRKVIDPEMSRSSYTMESIVIFANLASRCVRTESSDRPTMAECVRELQMIIYTKLQMRKT